MIRGMFTQGGGLDFNARSTLWSAFLVGVIAPEVSIVQPGFVRGLVEQVGFPTNSWSSYHCIFSRAVLLTSAGFIRVMKPRRRRNLRRCYWSPRVRSPKNTYRINQCLQSSNKSTTT